jgi:hypothetical protein
MFQKQKQNKQKRKLHVESWSLPEATGVRYFLHDSVKEKHEI